MAQQTIAPPQPAMMQHQPAQPQQPAAVAPQQPVGAPQPPPPAPPAQAAVAAANHQAPLPVAATLGAAAAAAAAAPKPAAKKRGPRQVCESCQQKKPTHGRRADVNHRRWCATCARLQPGARPPPHWQIPAAGNG